MSVLDPFMKAVAARAAMRTGETQQRGLWSPLVEARQAGFIALGCLMLLLGAIGALLPVMPTTIFLILAAWCFGRSSPRLEARVLEHPKFGPVIRDWREHGVMPRQAKLMAIVGMALGYALFWIGTDSSPWLAVLVAAPMIACAAYVATRPERARPAARNR